MPNMYSTNLTNPTKCPCLRSRKQLGAHIRGPWLGPYTLKPETPEALAPKWAYTSCGLAARRGFETQEGRARAARRGFETQQAARRGFETQEGCARAAGWQPDGLTRGAGWQPAGVLRPKKGVQELRAGSPQRF